MNKKVYTIEINGLQASVTQVEALISKLNELDSRINAIDSSKLNVSSSNDGGTARRSTALSEEEKILKQIETNEEKINALRGEGAKKLQEQKEIIKDINQENKASNAAERLANGGYANTMNGLKQELADIKQIMQTTDLGSDKFQELTTRANELTTKLKGLEEAYGQFGRNVGNYKSAFDGLKEVTVIVGDTERKFSSVKDASRQLTQELKGMVIAGKEGTKEFEELSDAVHEFEMNMKKAESTVNDLKASSKGMDTLLDTMESFIALGSITKGFSALFGFDDNEIQQSIQKLVALQNVLQGIEKIRQQMNTNEGFGAIFAKGNKAIDAMAKSILGIGTASKGATVAVKALSTALKSIGIGLVIAAITTLIGVVDKFIEKQKKAREETKKAREEENKAVLEYKMAKVELTNVQKRLDSFNGSKKEEEQLVKSLNSKYGTSIGQYKTLAEWKDALRKKTEAYCDVLKDEAKLATAVHNLEEAYSKQMNAKNYEPTFFEKLFEGSAATKFRVQKMADQAVKEAEDVVDKIVEGIDKKKQKNGLFEFAPTIDKDKSNKTKKEVLNVEEELIRIRIDSMREGLNKTIAQLEEEKRQRINKIKSNGNMVAELTAATEKLYEQKILDARKEFAERIEQETKEMWRNVTSIGEQAIETEADNIVKASENALDKVMMESEKSLKKIYANYAPDLLGIPDEILAQTRNIEGGIRSGKFTDDKENVVPLKHLEDMQRYLNLLEEIDFTEAQIYLLRRQYGEDGGQIFDVDRLRELDEAIKEYEKGLKEIEELMGKYQETPEEYEKRYRDILTESISEDTEKRKQKIQQEQEAEKKALEERLRMLDETYEKENEALSQSQYQRLTSLKGEMEQENEVEKKRYEKGEINAEEYGQTLYNIEEKYKKLAQDLEVKMQDDQTSLWEKLELDKQRAKEESNAKMLEIERKYNSEAMAINEEALQKELDEYRTTYDKIREFYKKTSNELKRLEEERDKVASTPIGETSSFSNPQVEAEIARLQDYLNHLNEVKRQLLEMNKITEEQIDKDFVLDSLRNENYTENLNKQFIARLGNHIKYYDAVEKAEREHWDTVFEQQKKALDRELSAQSQAADDELDKLREDIKKKRELELASVPTEEEIQAVNAKYDKMELEAEENTNRLKEQLKKKYDEDYERVEIEHQKNIQAIVANSATKIIDEYRDFYSKLSNVQSSLPIKNDWGIINLKETKKRNNELIESYTELAKAIQREKRELQVKLDKNEITFDDFTQARRELNDLETSVADSLKNINESSKDLIGEFIDSINQYVQQLGNSLTQLLSTLWQTQDTYYEKQLEDLNKQIDKYEELLDKQRDITQEHANAVNDIEDELSNARGDRRQQLIDQLNAEMDAQRKSIAEEKKAEREKKRLQDEVEKKEKAQRKRQHERDLTSAIISAALATVNGLATKPFIPVGIAMGALAASLGAAQVALIASQKYADGGVIVGKSHKEGGVQVLGGRAEVEGGEFITNKVTTAKNVDLLEYINTKKRKLNLDDLIEFYSGNSVKKNIKAVRTKFADGGTIPMLRADITSNDRLIRSFEDYANRPSVVQVVDIIDRTAAVNNVKVLAGLEV